MAASRTKTGKKSTKTKQPPKVDDETVVEIIKSNEPWSEYNLADGTVLRLKPVVAEVRRTNQYTEDGDPVYQAKSTIVVSARIPNKLRKKK